MAHIVLGQLGQILGRVSENQVGTSGFLTLKYLAQVTLISGPTQKMKEMKEFLRLSDLSQYVDVFQDMGYDSLVHLVRMNHRELMDLR